MGLVFGNIKFVQIVAKFFSEIKQQTTAKWPKTAIFSAFDCCFGPLQKSRHCLLCGDM